MSLKGIKNKGELLEKIFSFVEIKPIIMALQQAQGKCFLVGGAVRDSILQRPLKDIDIEIHQLSVPQVENILKKFGRVELVGKAFGVFKIHGVNVDWSLPRLDEKGRKPKVTVDPFLDITEALRRRDLTMNAMAIDLETGNFIDPFHGLQDLKKGILRTPDKKFFIEDPLRFYRVMQFIGRFEMMPDKELDTICKAMDVSAVSKERISEEFEKLLLKSKRPSLAFRWLDSLGRLKKLFPELYALKGLMQGTKYHPEGDVFEHTMQVLDAAALLDYGSDQEKLVVMYAALCHDLGKVLVKTKREGVKVHFYGHEQKGLKPTKNLLRHITFEKKLIDRVLPLVKYHMAPVEFVKEGAKAPAYKRLANKLAPYGNLQMLALLACADILGRNKKSGYPLQKETPEVDEFLEQSQDAFVLHKPEEPILKGRDLLGIVEPGPEMGKLLKRAYEIQIEEGISDKSELKVRIFVKKKK